MKKDTWIAILATATHVLGFLLGFYIDTMIDIVDPPKPLEMESKIVDKEHHAYDVYTVVDDVFKENIEITEMSVRQLLWLYFRNIDVANITWEEVATLRQLCIDNKITSLKIMQNCKTIMVFSD